MLPTFGLKPKATGERELRGRVSDLSDEPGSVSCDGVGLSWVAACEQNGLYAANAGWRPRILRVGTVAH